MPAKGPVPPRFKLCYRQLDSGSCEVEDCPFQHKILECEPCMVFVSTRHALEAHLNGKRHRQMQKRLAEGSPSATLIPSPPVNGVGATNGVNGKHVSPALTPSNGLSAGMPSIASGSMREGTLCVACNQHFPNLPKHFLSARHAKALRFQQYKAVCKDIECDKHGVEVLPAGFLDFGVIDVKRLATEHPLRVERRVTVENVEGLPVKLIALRMVSTRARYGNSSVNSKYHLRPLSHLDDQLRSGKTLVIPLVFDPEQISGRHQDSLELLFEDASTSPSTRFKIARPVLAIVTDPELHAILQPSAPYVRPERPARPARPSGQDVILGVAPPALAAIVWKVPLPPHPVPDWLEKRLLRTDGMGAKIKWLKGTQMPAVLCAGEYADYWKTVLWVEEVQMREDIRMYDISSTTLDCEARTQSFLLKVAGLAEKRPSVLIGDSVLVRATGETGRFHEGRVHQILSDKVRLRFHAAFRPLPGLKFHVQFSVNRIPLRRMHAAVRGAIAQPQIFFPPRPDHIVLPSNDEMRAVSFFDRKMDANRPQRMAVAAILNRKHPEVPFVIYGPPGTGKTSVVVEAVRQLHRRPSNRILVCAPSNSAADLLTFRLKDLGRDLFRLCAPSRNVQDVRSEIRGFTLQNDSGTFCVPPLKSLRKYRVVVCTCISASVLSGIGIEPGFYNHIFVDEAGQAMEPEVAIPVKTLLTETTEVVLAGDPKQLGPIIRSIVAQQFALDRSLLSRLMDRAAYSLPEHQGATLVKLVKNYRSHPHILRFPNEEFYKGELEPHADPVVTHSLLHWDKLPRKDAPCVFHNIVGEDKREGNSPSFWNPIEVAEVKRYVESLLIDNRKFKLTQNDIGIITPYAAQKTKIRRALERDFRDIKVGSVEEFQGQERRVIILSTVRSNEDWLSFDVKFSLGFVANPRRFNVAITRAQAALVVIGDARVLKGDELWRRFMNYLANEGCWQGPRPDWDTRAAVSDAATDNGLAASANLAAIDVLIADLRSTSLEDDEDAQEERRQIEEAAPDRDWRVLD